MRRRNVGNDEATDQQAQHELLAGMARVEALLRAALRPRLEKAVPKDWLKGRKRKILDFSVRPRTRTEIREHIGSIAGYEIKQFLEEGVQLGLLACSTRGRDERYQAVVRPPRSRPAKKRRSPSPDGCT